MTEASKSEIGQVVRERREALGLSREALAVMAGVSDRTLARIEAGYVRPRRATLAVIEQALADEEAEGVPA